MIQAACIVGKNNEPLYFYCNPSQYNRDAMLEALRRVPDPLEIEIVDPGEYLHLQMLCHSCLDFILEKKSRALQSTSPFELYLGQLAYLEDYRAYGCYSNTHNKVILLCDSPGLNSFSVADAAENNHIREAIGSIRDAFVKATQNPFHPAGQPIVSKRFDSQVGQLVHRFNSLYGSLSKRKI